MIVIAVQALLSDSFTDLILEVMLHFRYVMQKQISCEIVIYGIYLLLYLCLAA